MATFGEPYLGGILGDLRCIRVSEITLDNFIPPLAVGETGGEPAFDFHASTWFRIEEIGPKHIRITGNAITAQQFLRDRLVIEWPEGAPDEDSETVPCYLGLPSASNPTHVRWD